jgi:ankyrin repeat protein
MGLTQSIEEQFYEAFTNDNYEVMEQLLKRKKELVDLQWNIRLDTNAKEPVIVKAAIDNNLEKVKFLLKHNAQIDNKGVLVENILYLGRFRMHGNIDTALFYAVCNSNIEMIETLLDAGAVIYSKIFLSVFEYKTYNILQILVTRAGDSISGVVIEHAVKDLECAKIFMNVSEKYYRYCLYYAVVDDHIDVVKYIFDTYNLDVNSMHQGKTRLYLAAEEGSNRVCKYLLDRGADVEFEYEGKTPLFAAADKKHITTMLLFYRK